MWQSWLKQLMLSVFARRPRYSTLVRRARRQPRRACIEPLEDRQLLTIDLRFSSTSVAEQSGTTELTASLSAPATSRTTIDLTFTGPAVLGQDFTISGSQIVINSGAQSGTITVTSRDDGQRETPELIEARVATVTGTTEFWNGQPAYAQIMDDDLPLSLSGTTNNDVLAIWLYDSTFLYQLNNGPYLSLSYAQASSIEFFDTSSTDIDTVILTTPARGGSSIAASRDSIVVTGAVPFDLTGSNLERIYVNGNDRDQATMRATSGNDIYWGLPTHSLTSMGRGFLQVTGTRNVTIDGNGGTDYALLYSNGPTSVDEFRASPDSATMTKLRGLTGDTTKPFRNTVVGYRYVYGYADDANDVATFNDATRTNDVMLISPGQAYMLASTGTPYQNITFNYKNVVANSTGGNDAAYLYDSPGVDTLTANNVATRLVYADGANNLAQGFRDIYATSSWTSVLDNVFLNDSWIADIDATSADPLERSRDDHLIVRGTLAEMFYGNRRVGVTGFERLTASSTQGGTDTVSIAANSFKNPVVNGFMAEQSLTDARRTSLQLARAYLRDTKKFDMQRYMTRGTDYLNPEFADIVGRLSLEWSQQNPDLPALTAANLDMVIADRIYDYSRLEQVEKSLANIDRRSVLQRLFDELTRNAKDNVERQTAIIEFGHKSLQHNSYIQPLNFDLSVRARTGKFIADGTDVRDPLVLLELAEGRCGQVNKVVADIWHALGFRVRTVGVNSHTSGEVMYEGQWHYNDAGLFGGTEIALMPVTAGSSTMKVPSFAELRQDPAIVDRMALYVGTELGNRFSLGASPEFASLWYFENLESRYSWYEKGARADSVAQGSRDYGWYSGESGPIDWITFTTTTPPNTQPSTPYFTDVAISNAGIGGAVTLKWISSFDNIRLRRDDQGNLVRSASGNVIYDWTNPSTGELYSDVVGYRIFVSQTSRGWNYNTYRGFQSVAPNVAMYKASDAPWSPDMYDRRYATPPSEVMTLFVDARSRTLGGLESTTIQLPAHGTYYITIMAIDAKGLAIGKTNYVKSEEIRITT